MYREKVGVVDVLEQSSVVVVVEVLRTLGAWGGGGRDAIESEEKRMGGERKRRWDQYRSLPGFVCPSSRVKSEGVKMTSSLERESEK